MKDQKIKHDSLILSESIEDRILRIRGINIMVDTDLAELYGVTTKAPNQAVKRNKERFPQDFVFQLNKKEKIELVTNCDHLNQKLLQGGGGQRTAGCRDASYRVHRIEGFDTL